MRACGKDMGLTRILAAHAEFDGRGRFLTRRFLKASTAPILNPAMPSRARHADHYARPLFYRANLDRKTIGHGHDMLRLAQLWHSRHSCAPEMKFCPVQILTSGSVNF
jgi:hypothetical protein